MKESVLFGVALLAGLFSVCLPESAVAADRLNVVATLPSLGSIARAVGGERVSVAVLSRPGQDPHFVDPKPSFIVKVRDADLFILNGLELEVGWVPLLLEGSRNGKIQAGGEGYFDASAAISPIELPKGQLDRSLGDVHPFGNPHYTLDPLALRAVAEALAKSYTRLDPSGAEVYAAQAKAYRKRLDIALFGAELVDEVGGAKLAREAEAGRLDVFLTDNGLGGKLGGWLKKMQPLQAKPVVAFHTNMNYFWRRFGIVLLATVEPKPGIPPSAGHVADVVSMMRERKIGAVVTQPFYDDSAVKLIAEKSGAKVVKVETEGDDALAIIDAAVLHVADALR